MEEKVLQFNANKHDSDLIMRIAKRASEQFDGYSILHAMMDVTACHLNACPLRLEELAEADAFNFAHDILGINKHLNRDTGELMDCFLPRYAASKS
jgi:hypothetical protein